jgi:hypothetical protein
MSSSSSSSLDRLKDRLAAIERHGAATDLLLSETQAEVDVMQQLQSNTAAAAAAAAAQQPQRRTVADLVEVQHRETREALMQQMNHLVVLLKHHRP